MHVGLKLNRHGLLEGLTMTDGNGIPKSSIDVKPLGPGYLLIEPDAPPPPDSDVSLELNRALIDWQRKHPQHTVRATLPIEANGATTAIHVWYDEA